MRRGFKPGRKSARKGGARKNPPTMVSAMHLSAEKPKSIGLAQENARKLKEGLFSEQPQLGSLFPLFAKRSKVPVGEIRRIYPNALDTLFKNKVLTVAPGGKTCSLTPTRSCLRELMAEKQPP